MIPEDVDVAWAVRAAWTELSNHPATPVFTRLWAIRLRALADLADRIADRDEAHESQQQAIRQLLLHQPRPTLGALRK